MPQLLIFTSCERVIIDQRDGSASLITLFDAVTIPVPHGLSIPADALTPQPWYVFIRWQKDPDDEGRQYEQRVHFILPNGREANAVINTIELPPEAKAHQLYVTVSGLPTGLPGEVFVVLSLREAGSGNDWQEVARFPITVVHIEQPVPEGEDTNEQG